MCCPEKKILNETKNHNPPLQVKWSVPKEIVDDAAKDLNSIIMKAADKSVRKKINRFKSKKNKQVKRHNRMVYTQFNIT